MGNKLKRFLLCLLAVSLTGISGAMSSRADEDGPDETAVESSEEVSGEDGEPAEAAEEGNKKLKESEEKVELSEEEAQRLLVNIGSIEDYDVYSAGEDYEDRIWKLHGFPDGKPDKKAELTEKQESEKDAAEDDIKEVKKLGELVLVDPDKGQAIAAFDDSVKCDEGKRFISDGERYLLTVDADVTKPIKLMEVISTIDDPQLFRSHDKKTLELMSDDYKKVINTYYSGGNYDGKAMFFAGDDENFVWLNTAQTQVLGTFRYGAQNDKYRMIVEDRLGVFGLENLETGYIWWSSPLGATRDRIATPLLINELRSSNILRFGIPEKRSNNSVLRSGTTDCEITVKDIKNGIRVEYNYKKSGFKYPVEYTLEDDHLKASLKVSDIEESNATNVATEMTLLGSFGAAADTEDGYFVIPDGSGALVRFNNNKTMDTNAYTQRVYGNDTTVVPTSRGAVSEQIYLPVYGIVKENNGMLVVASKGDSNAYLTAQVSRQSNSSYNLCSFTFILRGTDTFYMSGNSNDKLTVFESGDIKSDDIELLYYPVEAEDGGEVSYVDIAERYRQYLTEDAGVKTRTEDGRSPVYIDLYGGALKKKPVLGIPVTMKQAITKYDEAQEILSQLKDSGVEDMVVSYNNWTNDGIKNKVDTGAKASGTLGGSGDLSKLKSFMESNDISFYPTSDNSVFYSGNGYYSFTSTCVRVSGSYSRIISYDRAYGIPDGFKKNMSLLSPSYFSEVFTEAGDSYRDAGINGISVGDLTTSLYGDYGKKNISRCTAMGMLTDSYKLLDDKLDDGILANSANAYALPYVQHITGVPLSSSRFDLFNEDVPFYQIVMHGIVPYSTTAVNGDADSESLLLMAAATGSSLSYDMLYEETSTLKDTEYDEFYYSNYENWISTIAAEYKLLEPILSDVSSSTITGYETENDGRRITTTYSNGSVVTVDFDERSVDFNGSRTLLDELEKGGVRF
ncbi:MAG: hypothetical protein IJ874_08365 [Ruminococcus sp.]|nr:hypothetical protein [Ruminococcus sp.]